MPTIKMRTWTARNALQEAVAAAVKREEAQITSAEAVIANGKISPDGAEYFRNQIGEAKSAIEDLRAIKVTFVEKGQP